MPQRTEPWNFELPPNVSQSLSEQAVTPRSHRLSEASGFSWLPHAPKKLPLISGNFSNKNSLNSHPLYPTPLVSLSRTTKAPPYIDCAQEIFDPSKALAVSAISLLQSLRERAG